LNTQARWIMRTFPSCWGGCRFCWDQHNTTRCRPPETRRRNKKRSDISNLREEYSAARHLENTADLKHPL